MATTPVVPLSGVNLSGTVLENLKPGSPGQAYLSNTLNSALRSQLSASLTKAGLPVIAGLVERMPPVDLVGANSLSVQAFAKQQLDPMVAKDAAMQQAVDGELAKLSDTTTIGTLLQLGAPLQSHSLFQADVMQADIASLLATSPTVGQNQQLHADFISKYAASTGTIQAFWNQISSDPEFKAAVPELQFTLQLGTLTINNAPLVAAIRKQRQPKTVRDLTALAANDWTQLITTNNISIPSSVPGNTAAEKTTNYVNSVMSALQSAYPTDYVAQAIATNPQDKFDQAVVQFLKSTPQFSLVTTNLQAYLGKNPKALESVPQEDQSAVLKRIGGYQRLTRLNSDPQIVSALMSKGLDSAYKISSLPRTSFLSQYSQLFGSSDRAQAVYDNAQEITASTLNFYTTVQDGLSNAHPWVLGNISNAVSDAIQQIPDWRELFGPTSSCACEECRSVLGAAAYFVDLLHFLSNAHIDPSNPASSTLYTILTGRRPDLADLKLNCENTNTTLPYVDLVNEILESVVVTHFGDPPRPLAHNTAPDATPDELSVNPEFTNDAAYNLLANAFYPFTLPFDRFLSVARTYLEFAGSSLYQVMKTFQIGVDPAVPANSNPNPTPNDQAIALEYLKISPNDFLILTGQPFQGTSPLTNPSDLAKYYGEPSASGNSATIIASPQGSIRVNNGVTITTMAPHNFSANEMVTVSGVNDSSFNGTFVVTQIPSPTKFTYNQTGVNAASGGGTAIVQGNLQSISPSPLGAVRKSNVVSISTTTAHQFSVGQMVMIFGVSDNSFNGTVKVTTVPSPTTFTFNQNGAGASSGGGSALADWYTDLSSVHNFLQRTGVEFTVGLLSLVETHFLNPSQSITLQSDAEDPCNIESVVIENLSPVDSNGAVDYTALSRVYRFIRLCGKLGWQVSDLDKVLTGLGATDIDASFLSKVSQIKQVQDNLSLTPIEVLGLWANLDTEGAQSLYISLFQNKGTLNPLNPAFTLRYTARLAVNSTLDLSFLKPYGAKISLTTTGQLQLTDGNGAPIQMTTNQERFLLSLSTDTNYQQAVVQLFLQNPASLLSLPAGVTLPAQLPDAIYYQGNELYCMGQMGDELRTQLKTLSADPNYQKAIDNLYEMRGTPDVEVAVATQSLGSQLRQLIPAQMVGTNSSAIQAALRISATDLAAIVVYLWSQSAPAVVVTPSDSGGALATGNYYIKISVVDAFGEWLYSSESGPIRVTGPNGSLTVTWPGNTPGAISYYVYCTVADGGPGNETIKINVPIPHMGVRFVPPVQTITTTAIGGLVLPGTAPTNLAYPLNLANLSAVYRHARLARALGVSAPDLLSLVQLIGINPFQPSTSAAPGTDLFVTKALELLRCKFSVAQMNYIYRNLQMPAAGLGLQQSDLDQFVSSLQSRLMSPPAEKSSAVDPTGNLLQRYLTKILEPADVSQAMGMINGTFRYSALLAALPPITLPDSSPNSLASRLRCDGVHLWANGPLSDADLATLLTLSTDSSYRTAVEQLYLQPRQFIFNKLFFLDTKALLARLVNDPTASLAEKFGFLLNALLNAIAVVIHSVSDSLNLDTAIVRRLLVGEQNPSAPSLLCAFTDPNLAAIVDFFALLGNGLSATYSYGGATVASQVDPIVDFDWSPDHPPVPGQDPNTFSAEWTGSVVAPLSETYTFYVQVVTGLQDTPAFNNPPVSISLRVNGNQLSLTQAQPANATNSASTLTPVPSGTITTTDGMTISWSSGATFDPSWTGATIIINGAPFTIESVQSTTTLKISGPAAAHSGPYSVTGLPFEYTATAALIAGKLTSIELDYPNAAASTVSSLRLSWSSVSTPESIIPQNQLYADSSFTFDLPLRTLGLLGRIALLVTTLRITVDDLSFLSTHSTAFAGLDPNDPSNLAISAPFNLKKLPADASSYWPALFNQWERLLAFISLRDRLAGGNASLLGLLTTAAASPIPSGSALISAVAAATGWNPSDLAALIGSQSDPLTPGNIGFGLTAGDFVDERWLVRLQSCLALTARFGSSPRHLFEWATLGLDSVTEPNIARDIQAAIKAAYDDTTWMNVGKSLNDKLRESSRDALVAYILAPPAKWELAVDSITTPDQLYEYFLIDVEMGSCMLTSRIVQATAAVQLFVQRCLMNLEEGISPAAINRTIWEWMKNYRVWQANREVFLYPENWIDPTLRDDKTPFFQDLEIELQQNELTADAIEQALRNYLEKLHQVARLEPCAIYWQFDPSSTTLSDGTPDASHDILHVFAHTSATPRIYFYRQLLNASGYGKEDSNSTWTPWERVDLDIEGDHLVATVWNRSVHLFWPIFSEAADPNNPAPSDSPANKFVSIKLAWSEYKQGKWSAKQVSTDRLFPFFGRGSGLVSFVMSQDVTPQPPEWTNLTVPVGDPDVRWLTFQAAKGSDDQLSINVYIDTWTIPGHTEPLVYGPDNGWKTPYQFPFDVDGATPIAPQTGVWMEGALSFASCGGKVTASGPSLNPPPPHSSTSSYPYQEFYDTEIVATLIAPNTVIEYTSLREIGGVSTFSLGWSNQTASAVSVLDNTSPWRTTPPTPFHLTIDQGASAASSGTAPGFCLPMWIDSQYFQPFFYEDDYKVYFADVMATRPAFQVPVGTPVYSPAQLKGSAKLAETTFTPGFESLILKSPMPATLATMDSTKSGPPSPLSTSITRTLTTTTGNTVGSNSALGFGIPGVQFWTHFHPHVCAFIQGLNQYGIRGLLNLGNQQLPGGDATQTAFESYVPDQVYVVRPYPTEHVDFSPSGAYSAYNWELFFHIPLLIATKLSQQQKFEEAQKWFHYIFDPTSNSGDPVPQRFWNFLPFHECSSSDEIEGSIQRLLSQLDQLIIFSLSAISGPVGTMVVIAGANFGPMQGASTVTFNGIPATPLPFVGWSDAQIKVTVPTGATTGNVVVTVNGVASNGVPFTVSPTTTESEPSECGQDVESQVAQWRLNPFDPFLIARMRTIAFRKNVVMKYLDNLIAWGDYMFSQNTRESINDATQVYVLAQQILGDKPVTIDPPGTVLDCSYQSLVTQGLDDFSNALVTLENTFPFSTGSSTSAGGTGTGCLNGVGRGFYFCIPDNDQLLGYWDTVADRLYKIRHCMNIKGVVEQLALFAPPINPALLVQATAMGLDLSSVLNEITAPTPNYRFSVVLQKALEVCAEVRSFGGALLSALEKNDAEGLSVLRSTQEISLLQSVVQIKQSQIDEANKNLAGLQASYAVTVVRQAYYQQLIGTGQTSFETTQISELKQAQTFQEISQGVEVASGIAALLPNATLGLSGAAASPVVTATLGGVSYSAALAAVSRVLNMIASLHSYHANVASITGGWDRRSQDWDFQLQTATGELTRIQREIDAATIRAQIANADLENQKLQIANAQAVLDFLNNKYTNQELYGWMVSQVSALYFQCYQMAYGLAKRAEVCFRLELGLTDSNYIRFGYWDSLRKGLLFGERLYSDLKRMDVAYLDQNMREYEITKNISLVLLDPIALITLKETGQCMVSLPEALFDMDYPGQYMRRIKSLSMTIPCVTGPYTSVNCKLTLASSKIRVDSVANSPQDYGQDSHFISNFAAAQSIATSSGLNDSGLFELNFRDERYLPFEGAGVVSQWFIELPKDCNAFDFETISDVVINLRYTARDGGDALRAVAKRAATLPAAADQDAVVNLDPASFPKQSNLARLFSMRHEFPTEWNRFLNPLAADPAQTMLLALTKERFPFQYRGKTITVSAVDLVLKFKDINSSQFTTGTPLGDFGSSSLNIYITPVPISTGPQQAPTQPAANSTEVPLTSSAAKFNSAPYCYSSGVSPNLSSWWLQVFKSPAYLGSVPATLLDANGHLLASILDDIFMVFHYSVA